MKGNKTLREKLRNLFECSQEQSGQQRLVDKCKNLYISCENEETFLDEFITALRYCFVFREKPESEKMLSFAAKFAVSMYNVDVHVDDSDDMESSDMHPFVKGLFDFLFSSHGANHMDARLRCVQLINKILSTLPENSSISDEVWTKLSDTVLCRIQDKNPNVRVQAVLTARKLQDPKNSSCQIIEALAFHLNDPSAAVRRAVVSSIALNKITIGFVLARTRDVNDNVRRNAFIVFSKVRVVNLTIKYRVTILERGLQDRSDLVRNCVQNLVVVHWLENFNKDVLKLLEALDVVTCPNAAILTLKSIFKTQPMDNVLKCLPIDENTRLVPLEDLTPEVALLWRCLAEHFREADNEDELELILPNLVTFCDYVQRFYPTDKNMDVTLTDDEQWAEVKDKQILIHLLELAKCFDYSDEMGRSSLKKLIVAMLTSSRTSSNIVECLIQLMVPVMPDTDSLLQELTEVISEVKEPLNHQTVELPQRQKIELELKVSDLKVTLNELREREYHAVQSKDYSEAQKLKEEIDLINTQLEDLSTQQTVFTQEVREEKNDPVTLCKCLSILLNMIKYSGVKTLTTTLRTLKENFLNQCMTSQDLLTQSLAIQSLAQFCILDKELAKENLFRFIVMLSENGENEINIPALKAVFDIIHKYGVQSFEKFDESTGENPDESKSKRLVLEDELNDTTPEEKLDQSTTGAKCLSLLKELVNCKTNDALKTVAFEGLCKLLLSGVVFSPSLLTQVIVKGFSPIVDSESEDFIRQVFMVFFPMFASSTPRSQEMIESAFIPTMRIVMFAPYGTPEGDINPKDVASFLIEHTKSDINHYTSKTLHVHNNLALSICHEILKDYNRYNELGMIPIYQKSLLQLGITPDEPFIVQLQTLSNKIEEEIVENPQMKLLKEFEKKLEEKLHTTVQTIDNTLLTTATKDGQTTKGSSLGCETTSIDNTLSTTATKDGQTTKGTSLGCETLASDVAKISLSTESDRQSEVPPCPRSPDISLPAASRPTEANESLLEETLVSESDESYETSKMKTVTKITVPESPDISIEEVSSPERVTQEKKRRVSAVPTPPVPRTTRQSSRSSKRSLRKL